mmetsp:Transcript_77173/g.174568  ORF Transcript_77173/g.174568 Transcript_77173/m.174568 type:complete len:403 (+) Transcript_77173:118-1326(+)
MVEVRARARSWVVVMRALVALTCATTAPVHPSGFAASRGPHMLTNRQVLAAPGVAQVASTWATRTRRATAPVVATTMLFAAIVMVHGHGSRKTPSCIAGRNRALVTSRAVENDNSEASKLEREAAKLREEAQELEKAKAIDRRAARAKQLLGADSSPGTTIGPDELRAKVKEVDGLELSADEVKELLASGAGGQDKLGFEDLASFAFDAALDRLRAVQDARLGAELARRQQELADKREQEKFTSGITDMFSGDDDDSGPAGRVIASLPYLLPLVDGLPYGGSLAGDIPALETILIAFGPLLALKSVIPFGTFIFLIGFQFLCRNPELPGLLRYNLRQAAVIDILILLPQFIQGFTSFELPAELDVPLFILMALSVVYSLVLTALGKTPNGLGFISDATDRGL